MQTEIYQKHIITLSYLSLFIVALLWSCAEPRAPEGGPQDKQPPRIHPKKFSTPNPSTNFQFKEVILTFDEWVKLQSAYNQVVISPPLEQKPSIKVRNKSVVVAWKEELKDSTTYIINFGDAVQDITEGNIVPNLKMVFSTGAFLDSLTCSGQIIDAKTRKPKEDVLVMLYQNLSDTAPKTLKPYYFTKTNKQGTFSLEYLKEGRYRVFALEDKNRDYKYNLTNESIAFLDSSFLINDTITPVIRLRMFKEKVKIQVLNSRLLSYGALKVELNNVVKFPINVALLNAPKELKIFTEQGEDSLKIWFDAALDSMEKWRFVLYNEQEDFRDTIAVTAKSRENYLETVAGLRWVKKGPKEDNNDGGRRANNKTPLRPLLDTLPIQQHPFEPLSFDFTRPVEAWDTSKFLLFKDTNIMVIESIIEEKLDSLTEETWMDTTFVEVNKDTFLQIERPALSIDPPLQLTYNWEESARYKLMVLPRGLSDFFGLKNTDTLSRVYVINKKEDYGNITALVKNAVPSQQYVVQLVDAKERVLQEDIMKDSTQMTFVYKNMEKGTYTIRIIHDDLANGEWDVGDYDKGRQSEQITNSKPIGLNSGWENTMEVDLAAKASDEKTPRRENNRPKEPKED